MTDDQGAASPYARACAQLAALGYHAIPVMPREKAPGEVEAGRWRRMSGWQRFRDRAPSDIERTTWARGAAGANIGLVLGSTAGDDTYLIAVDIDAEDPDAFDDIAAALPASPMVKRGAKGETRFYRADRAMRSASYDDTREGGRTRLVDLLTGFDARQTVVPPSAHVDRAGVLSGKTYGWLAGPVASGDLPRFTADDLLVLEETLICHGWAARPPPTQHDAAHKNEGLCATVNTAALVNLGAWVPQLGLYRCRSARDGYAAVATWRGSSGGRPSEKRARNLSIQPMGIKDFGTGETYSPIDLVIAARGGGAAQAAAWLRERVGAASSLPFMGRVDAAQRQTGGGSLDGRSRRCSCSGANSLRTSPP